jgi:hypothetical protein
MVTFALDIIEVKKYIVLVMSIIGISAVLGTSVSFFS